jgi:putative salt-induced outer membrane protein
MLSALLLAAAAPAPPPAAVDPIVIPAALRSMLDAAMSAGDDAAVSTILKYTRAADPASADAMLQIAQDWRNRRAQQRDERLRMASAFELWTGRIEAGGFASTGNSRVTGLTGVADIKREALKWRHKLRMQADYQRSAGVTSREHYLASYEPNYKVDDRAYVYGSAQFEADRFFGYEERYSLSVGAGYGAIRRPGMTLDVELGPGFRHTGFTDGNTESSLAARGSIDFDWKLASGLTLSQNASAYVQRYNSTATGTTAVAAKLIGPLSAQLSYTVQYESEPPEGRVSTDTTSRASLVYAF